jgi:hypothetical protein
MEGILIIKNPRITRYTFIGMEYAARGIAARAKGVLPLYLNERALSSAVQHRGKTGYFLKRAWSSSFQAFWAFLALEAEGSSSPSSQPRRPPTLQASWISPSVLSQYSPGNTSFIEPLQQRPAKLLAVSRKLSLVLQFWLEAAEAVIIGLSLIALPFKQSIKSNAMHKIINVLFLAILTSLDSMDIFGL